MAKRGKVTKEEPLDELERPRKWRRYDQIILIVCEDQKTEPYYFSEIGRSFPDETLFLYPVGTGKTTIGVVQDAMEYRQTLADVSRKNVDETWVVFDKDNSHLSAGGRKNFIDAFELAKQEDIKVAYSNEAFELWLLLHFTGVSQSRRLGRSDIYTLLGTSIKQLNGYSNFIYDHKVNERCIEAVNICMEHGNVTDAIQRANSLNKYHLSQGRHPIDSNPNTTVFELIQRLLDLKEYYTQNPDE